MQISLPAEAAVTLTERWVHGRIDPWIRQWPMWRRLLWSVSVGRPTTDYRPRGNGWNSRELGSAAVWKFNR